MKVDYAVVNTAAPFVFASLESKVISVPVYTLSLIIDTPVPIVYMFCS